MDPLQPITPRPQLPSIDRAAPSRRVEREPDLEQDEARQRRQRERQPAPEQITEGAESDDDGRPHVDISV